MPCLNTYLEKIVRSNKISNNHVCQISSFYRTLYFSLVIIISRWSRLKANLFCLKFSHKSGTSVTKQVVRMQHCEYLEVNN